MDAAAVVVLAVLTACGWTGESLYTKELRSSRASNDHKNTWNCRRRPFKLIIITLAVGCDIKALPRH